MFIYGPSSVGKSELLYRILSACILPRKWNEHSLGGNEGGVLLLDNDYRVSMPRLIAILEADIRLRLRQEVITDNDVQEIIVAALSRLRVMHCRDDMQFIITLQSIPQLLETDPSIKLIMIDSISTFYWTHKHVDKLGMEYQKQIAQQCRQLALNGIIIFATKSILWKEKKEDDVVHSGTSTLDTLFPHQEYLYTWGRIVKYRIILNILQDQQTTNQFIAKLVMTQPLNSSAVCLKTNLYKIKEDGLVFL